MEQVEDVLRTLSGPDNRFRTVRATIRHSRDVDLERRSGGFGRPSLGRNHIESGGGSKSPRITTSVAKIWLNRPGRARIEERREMMAGVAVVAIFFKFTLLYNYIFTHVILPSSL
jgi:hypothetical protein